MAELEKRVTKALEIARDFGQAELKIEIAGKEEPKIAVLFWSWGGTSDERIAKALKYVPRLRRYQVCGDSVWADARTEDDIKIDLANIGKCVRVETKVEIEEPEMIPTGKIVKRTVTKVEFVCPDAEEKKA